MKRGVSTLFTKLKQERLDSYLHQMPLYVVCSYPTLQDRNTIKEKDSISVSNHSKEIIGNCFFVSHFPYDLYVFIILIKLDQSVK